MQTHEKLVKLAEQRGLHLGNQITPAHRAALERLSRLQGPAFTRDYLRHTMAALEQQRARFQVAQTLDDPNVAQFAKDSLPDIDTRLAVTRAVYDSQVAAVP
ncbi:MAG: DUF4142 domain-containing protein [Magnetospirillum sp.]|nr:DUF4142 domain-containing protein [Magnetospirillum sp.]